MIRVTIRQLIEVFRAMLVDFNLRLNALVLSIDRERQLSALASRPFTEDLFAHYLELKERGASPDMITEAFIDFATVAREVVRQESRPKRQRGEREV